MLSSLSILPLGRSILFSCFMHILIVAVSDVGQTEFEQNSLGKINDKLKQSQ